MSRPWDEIVQFALDVVTDAKAIDQEGYAVITKSSGSWRVYIFNYNPLSAWTMARLGLTDTDIGIYGLWTEGYGWFVSADEIGG